MRYITKFLGAGLFAAGMAAALPAQAVTINFDSFANNTVITNQYPEATFSSPAATGVYTISVNFGTSLPNVIGAGTGYGDGSGTITVDFTAPVSNLTYWVVGDNNGNSASVDVWIGGLFNQTVLPAIDGNSNTPDLVNLTAFGNVTRIVLANSDFVGIGYDDFSFNVGAAVPEPASLALLGAGLIGLALARRRASRVA